MATMASPYKLATDSPSRQLLYELSRLGVTSQEIFYARLDHDNHAQELLHKEALSLAAAEHDRVRETAVAVQQQLQLQIEAEGKRRDEEERKRLEKLRQERAEEEIAEKRRAIEQAKIDEAHQRRLAEAREAAAAAEQRKAQREQENTEAANRSREAQDAESKRRQAEEEAKRKTVVAESKAREAPIADEKARAASSTTQPRTRPSLQTGLDAERIAEHQRYVEIHRKLKDLRKSMMDEAKKNKALKDTMGDIRRGIRQSVGQLTMGKGVNKIPLQKIITGLKQAISFGGPNVDITQYLAFLPSNAPDTSVPVLLLYELNIFAKAVIAQFIDEAGVSPKTADPVGVIASHIFTYSTFRWNDTSLIDILLAKLHVVCPILFGIYGDDTTNEGRRRIGWWRGVEGGPWVSEQRHCERMTGLGAGFAALGTRNYSKTEMKNPFPNYKYWQSLSYILNTPQQAITQTHLVVLKAMIENNETRILEIFGSAGKVVLRQALLEFPKRNPGLQRSVAAVALGGLADVLKKDKKIYL